MEELKSRIRAKFSRRNSAAHSLSSSTNSDKQALQGNSNGPEHAPSVAAAATVGLLGRQAGHSTSCGSGSQADPNDSASSSRSRSRPVSHRTSSAASRPSNKSSRCLTREEQQRHQQDHGQDHGNGTRTQTGPTAVDDVSTTAIQVALHVDTVPDSSNFPPPRSSTSNLASINENQTLNTSDGDSFVIDELGDKATKSPSSHPKSLQVLAALPSDNSSREADYDKDGTRVHRAEYNTATPSTTLSTRGTSPQPSSALDQMPRNASSGPGGSGSHRQHTNHHGENESSPAALLKALLQAAQATESAPSHRQPQGGQGGAMPLKIWVRRPGASPTVITVGADDLVDDVRDLILRKYHNSLGRHFDSPDITIRISPREKGVERTLGPEEHIGEALDSYYPGGQAVDEALVIDTPARKTPRGSPHVAVPHHNTYYANETRPVEGGEGYFPPVVTGASPPHGAPPMGAAGGNPHAISILSTGQAPPLGSPGGGTRSRAYRERTERPRLGRTHTSSPTIMGTGKPAPNAANATDQDATPVAPPSAAHATSPTAPETSQPTQESPPATARGASPRPAAARSKKLKKNSDGQKPPVPPINVLLVEDNPINLKLLEAFAKGLKIRWQSAMNGRDAVAKWRKGGYHLVLMDIQLPVMNGLDATREIRRLERLNSIGVFTTSRGKSDEESADEMSEEDRLSNRGLFKSPVIIVALTASSLQSDRHEALAAGCNDFITKPVSFPWLEMKVREWGCMQALIDFDGWRKWKDFSQEAEKKEEAEKKAASAKAAEKKAAKSKRVRMTHTQPASP